MNSAQVLADRFSGDVVRRENGHGFGVFAARDFRAGEKVLVFDAVFTATAHRHTIQLDEVMHLETEGHIGVLLSHSCAPNTRFCGEELAIFAIAPIGTGKEITFNYLCTEWDMAAPFECSCGSERCYRVIRGFRYLSVADQQALEPFALPYLRKLAQAL